MGRSDIEPLRAILHRAIVRYLTVTARGLVLDGEPRPVSLVDARILGFGGARTLYRRRKPTCRSLDGAVAIDDPERRCAECDQRGSCTPQVRVDLIVHRRAYRLLLAFTSARNFLEYEARLRPTAWPSRTSCTRFASSRAGHGASCDSDAPRRAERGRRKSGRANGVLVPINVRRLVQRA